MLLSMLKSNMSLTQPHGSTKKDGPMTQLTLPPQQYQNPLLVEESAETSLPSSVRSKLKPTYDPEYNLLGYKLVGTKLEVKEIDKALDILKEIAVYPTKDEVILAITRLYALCAPSADSDDTLHLRISAYTDKLLIYPRDAVLYVLEKAPDNHRWFPSWHDLKKELDHVTKKRRSLASVLEQEQTKQRVSSIRAS